MAKKKSTTVRRRARRAVQVVRRTARRKVTLSVQDIALAVAGGVLLEKVAPKVKLFKEGESAERNNMLVLAAAAGFGAFKTTGALRSVMLGATVAAGVKAAALMLPDLGGDKVGGYATNSLNKARTIGRLQGREEDQIRAAVARQLASNYNTPMNGTITGTITGTKRRGSVFA